MKRRLPFASVIGPCVVLVTVGVNAAVHPNESFSDLWDYSTGARVTNSTPSDYMPVNAAIGQIITILGTGENDVFFRDGFPLNHVYFMEWSTPSPVTVNHFRLFGWDDRSTGAPGRRGIATFRLYGFQNGAYQQVFSGNPVIPYPDQNVATNQAAMLFDADITAITSNMWRAEFQSPATYSSYGPRVIELDGTFIPEPSSAACFVIALLALSRRRA